MTAGSKPGERRGGRQRGTPNKATAEIKVLAREHGPEAIKKLVGLMRGHDKQIDRLGEKILALPADSAEMTNLLQHLLALLSGRNIASELGAAKELLDRGFGKPTFGFALDVAVAVTQIERIIVYPEGAPEAEASLPVQNSAVSRIRRTLSVWQ